MTPVGGGIGIEHMFIIKLRLGGIILKCIFLLRITNRYNAY
jgi:hypothetical protein